LEVKVYTKLPLDSPLRRKEIRQLSSTERGNFFKAIGRLHQLGVWDFLADWHLAGAQSRSSKAHEVFAAHAGPAFLPWHRAFSLIFEHCLRAAGYTGGAPYWDVTIEAGSSDATKSVLFTEDYFGGSGTVSSPRIPNGMFAISKGCRSRHGFNNALERCIGCDSTTLPTADNVKALLGMANYDSSPFTAASRNSFRNELEGWGDTPAHNHVHVFIGGTMLSFSSPIDGIFWMNHNFIDRIWAGWQANGHAGIANYAKGVSFIGHRENDAMFPWKLTVKQMMNTEDLGYVYDTLPTP
jgi:tyrosinase